MEQVSIMERKEKAPKPPKTFPRTLPGQLIIQFLQEMKEGATMREIVRFVSAECGKDTEELTSYVVNSLENGAALGFLERKGPHSLNWAIREPCDEKTSPQSSQLRMAAQAQETEQPEEMSVVVADVVEDLPDAKPERVEMLNSMEIESVRQGLSPKMSYNMWS